MTPEKPQEVETLLSDQEVDMLEKAFDAFNRTTTRLQQAYQDLKEHVQTLNLELERANEELLANQGYLNNILQSLTNGVIVVNLDRTVTHINRAASELLWMPSHEAVECPLSEIFRVPLDEKDFELVKETGVIRETLLPRKGERKGIPISYSLSPLMDPQGAVMGSVLVFSDLSQMKRLEEQVQRSKRLSAMGEMAASLAHEIRNPLGSLELFSSLLRRELEGDADKAGLADNIIMVVKNLTNITSNLLFFARPCTPVLQPVSVNAILDETLVFCQHLINQSEVTLAKKFSASDHMVDIDRELMKQVFLNIILNALQAMEDGGKLTITTASHRGCIEIEIGDTGPGIEGDALDRIFDPFFTTKERGTGLGLAIVHNIVRAHNGAIEVKSKKGKGTTFLISLPMKYRGKERRSVPRTK
ncbi:MAG: ATP-binding protein [Nitrospirota bacterium]|nr:ATP-binding protein [Nitrospirota bacterium]